MSRDLTIRLLGRPQVTVDKRTGFNKLSRRYVVQGPRATKDGIDDASNPLFLAAGVADEEFTDYYLVDQSLAPASGTLDKAYLSREYLQLSSSAITEAFQQTNDLIRVRKRFAVLRNNNETLGYGAASWAKHPSQATTYAQDPWEYAPSWVANATPGSRNYTVTNADDANEHGFTESPQINGQDLGTYISSHASTGDWLKGYAVMSQAGSGLDIWTVEWVTHAPPYWQLGTGRGNRSRTSSVRVLAVDSSGVFEKDSLSSSGSVSYATRIMSYTFFVKGESIPSDLASIGGGSGSVSFTPVVRSNFDITMWDAESGRSTALIREVAKQCVWDGDASLNLTRGDGTSIEVGRKVGSTFEFDWDAIPTNPVVYKGEDGEEYPKLDSNGDGVVTIGPSDRAIFNGKTIEAIHGKISWTMHRDSYSWSSSSGTFGQTRTQITPIFSHGSEKIWKVAITYVGG